MDGCPVRIDIPAFIGEISKKNYEKAIRIIKEGSSLPAVCGRVCPAEDNCENNCILKKKGEPVAIATLERFASDMEKISGKIIIPELRQRKDTVVAVIGSGPAGVSCAGDLAKMGYTVTLFEAFHKAGGVLIYGIPEFRLPKEIVQREIEYLEKIGVEVKLDSVIGKLFTIDELFEKGYMAVFVGTGAGLPLFLHVPGENLNGVMSANEFLTRSNLMKAYNREYETPIPCREKVAVIGGGNVAMDAARTAVRLGGKEVTIVYRRSTDEMPARPCEVHHGEEEGIKFQFLSSPISFSGDSNNWVREMRCQRMRLGEPDSSGRRRPVPVPGDEFTMDVDEVVIAIGNNPNPLISRTTPDLNTSKWGNIIVEPEKTKTSKEGVFAGGDIVTGSATVISAMAAGRAAAKEMDEYINARGNKL
jgi:glutamate synthase (NADPH/NADH) small chain